MLFFLNHGLLPEFGSETERHLFRKELDFWGLPTYDEVVAAYSLHEQSLLSEQDKKMLGFQT